MTQQLSFEELNDLLDDNLSADECSNYLDRLIKHSQQNEFNRLAKAKAVIFQSQTSAVPESLLKFDISTAVMGNIEPCITSNKASSKSNVISVLFGKPKLNLAIAASVLFVGLNMSYFLIQQDIKPIAEPSIAQSTISTPAIDLELQQQLVAKDIEEQERNLQETLLKHRLLQQGFFPSELVSSQTSDLVKTVNWQESPNSQEKDTLPINFYYQTRTNPQILKVANE